MWQLGASTALRGQVRRFHLVRLSAAGLVLAGTVCLAGSAAAAASAGYTASYIPLAASGVSPGVTPVSVAFDPVTGNVYVGELNTLPNETDQVAVVNPSSGATVVTIPLPVAGDPSAIAVDSATGAVYVADGGDIAVIDDATNSVSTTIPLPAGTDPVGIAVDSTTNTIYVTNDSATDGGVVVIDGGTNNVTSTVSSGGAVPIGIAVDEATDLIWVADYYGNTVAAISGVTGSVVQSVSVTDARDIAVNPVTDTVYVLSDVSSRALTVIDGANGTVTTTVPVSGGQFAGVAVDPSANVVFVQDANGSGTTSTAIIDGATNAVADVLDVSTDVIPTVDPATDTVYEIADVSVFHGIWAITPSAANGISPLMSGPSAAVADVGVSFETDFSVVAAQPSATVSETGALPAGLTFSPTGVLSGVPVTGTDGNYPMTITASNGVAPDYTISFTLTVSGQLASAYTALGPVRVLDTRNGTGVPQAPVGQGGTISLRVTGIDGVPASGVTAVVLNVTATDPTMSSYVTVFPAGQPVPVVSNLNVTPGETIANLVTVPVGSDGMVDFYNNSGSVNLVADLEGYYSATGSLLESAGPVRIMDTRNGTGGSSSPVGPGGTISLQVTGVDGVPATGVTAVVLNVTVTDPTASSYVTVYPGGTTRPVASNLNFTAGETIPNLVTVPVGSDGMVDFYNNSGSTDLVADLDGYYGAGAASAGGSFFNSFGPVRVLDTRSGLGGYRVPVGPGQTISLLVNGAGSDIVNEEGVTAVVLNVTVTNPTASSYVTVYPDGTTRPVASNLNFTAGETIANLVVVPVGADGEVDFYNNSGSTDVIADVFGYFLAEPASG
jgi:YVTN family beta-propeller protein